MLLNNLISIKNNDYGDYYSENVREGDINEINS